MSGSSKRIHFLLFSIYFSITEENKKKDAHSLGPCSHHDVVTKEYVINALSRGLYGPRKQERKMEPLYCLAGFPGLELNIKRWPSDPGSSAW